jgi:hypothetical protein
MLAGATARSDRAGPARPLPDLPRRRRRVVALRDGVHIERWESGDLAPSNAVCRKLGFSLVEAGLSLEYPPGAILVCNDWRREP